MNQQPSIENIVENLDGFRAYALSTPLGTIEVGIEIGTGEWTISDDDGDIVDYIGPEDSALLINAASVAEASGIALDLTGGNAILAKVLVLVAQAEVQS